MMLAGWDQKRYVIDRHKLFIGGEFILKLPNEFEFNISDDDYLWIRYKEDSNNFEEFIFKTKLSAISPSSEFDDPKIHYTYVTLEIIKKKDNKCIKKVKVHSTCYMPEVFYSVRNY